MFILQILSTSFKRYCRAVYRLYYIRVITAFFPDRKILEFLPKARGFFHFSFYRPSQPNFLKIEKKKNFFFFNFIFIFSFHSYQYCTKVQLCFFVLSFLLSISPSDPNLLQKKSVKQKIKKPWSNRRCNRVLHGEDLCRSSHKKGQSEEQIWCVFDDNCKMFR